MAGNQVAEVIRLAGVAPFLDHHIEAGGTQAGKLFERLQNEGQIGVDRRRAMDQLDGRQAGLGQNAGNTIAMQVELRGCEKSAATDMSLV